MRSVRQRPMRPTLWVAALFTLAVTWTMNVDDVHAAPKRIKGATKITKKITKKTRAQDSSSSSSSSHRAKKKPSSSSAPERTALAPGQPETMRTVPAWDGLGSYAFGPWKSNFALVFANSAPFQSSYKTTAYRPEGDVAWPLPLEYAGFEIADVLSDGWCSLYAVNAALQAARGGRPSPLDEFFVIHDTKISADGGDARGSGDSASSSKKLASSRKKPEARLGVADVFRRRGEAKKELRMLGLNDKKGKAFAQALATMEATNQRYESLTAAIDTTRREAVIGWLLENTEGPINAFAHPAGNVAGGYPLFPEYKTVDKAFALNPTTRSLVDSEAMGFLAQKLKRDIIVFAVADEVPEGECPSVRTYRADNRAQVVDEARLDQALFVLYRGHHFYALKPPQNFTHADYLQMLKHPLWAVEQ